MTKQKPEKKRPRSVVSNAVVVAKIATRQIKNKNKLCQNQS